MSALINASKLRPFKQVDVFTATPYLGNPLAVVLDGAGLSDAEMAAFARWTNLSETTFVLPATQAEADYRVRIFTPGAELAFAGHPTLGTCHAWLEAGGIPKASKAKLIVQECPAGLVRLQQTPSGLAFAAPPLKRSAPSATQLAQIAGALGLKSQQIIAAQVLDNGTTWLGLLLDSTDTVLALTPNHLELKNIGLKVGVAGVYSSNNATQLIAKSSREARAFGAQSSVLTEPEEHIDLEVRGFAAPVGIFEDPVTGSLNASLAQWLIEDGYMPANYIAAQGMCLDRAGRVHISRDTAGQVWVGGAVVTCIDGMVKL